MKQHTAVRLDQELIDFLTKKADEKRTSLSHEIRTRIYNIILVEELYDIKPEELKEYVQKTIEMLRKL